MFGATRYVALFVISLTASFSVHAQTTYDVNQFEVSGVKLGMSVEQAVEGLVKHYGIKRGKIALTNRPKPLQITGAENVPRELRYKPEDIDVFIFFEPSLAVKDTHQSVVSSVSVESKNQTPESIVQAAVKQYGPYTFIRNADDDPENRKYLWCNGLDSRRKNSCDRSSLILVEDRTLKILDHRYLKTWKGDVKKWKEAKGIK